MQIDNVSVPNVGSNILEYIDYIDRSGYFEAITLSEDDLHRNDFYNSNKIRTNESFKFNNYDDFLLSLNMFAEIKSFSLIYIERITQLINKTNQFNLTTKRYSITDIQNIHKNGNYIKIYGKLKDKFGDNGLISSMIGEIIDDTCHIRLWIMSCRVLKRNMELAMFDYFVKECARRNIYKIIGSFYPTKKNNMVSNLYSSIGFDLISQDKNGSLWVLEVEKYRYKNKLIRVNYE